MKTTRRKSRAPVPGRTRKRIAGVIALALLPTLPVAAPAAEPTALDELESVGAKMGYRLYGESRRDEPILLQNSRPHRVQVFDEKKGVYVSVPPFSDMDFPCDGKARLLHVRYSDAFGERAPFRVSIGCGREIQFMAPEQLARPVPVPVAPPSEGVPVIAPLEKPEDTFNDPAIVIEPMPETGAVRPAAVPTTVPVPVPPADEPPASLTDPEVAAEPATP